jgi:hypothetical protein
MQTQIRGHLVYCTVGTSAACPEVEGPPLQQQQQKTEEIYYNKSKVSYSWNT